MPGLMLLGADHRVAPFEIRDKLAVKDVELGDVLGRLSRSAHIREVFLLSTNHQTEVYVRGYASALDDIRLFWQERAGIALDGLTSSIYEKRDHEAVYHLFTHAAGLNSVAALGAEPLGQIKDSLTAAREAGTLGGYLDALLSRSIKLARRIRRDFGPEIEPSEEEEVREGLRREADRFIRWARSRRATTAISAMKERAEEIRRGELLKMEGKLRHLSPEEREALEALTLSIVNKLLDPSKKALKEAVGLGDASHYLQAASELFDLGDP